MKITKLISVLLTVIMLMSAFAVLVSAEEEGPKYSVTTGDGKSNMGENKNSATKDDEPYLYKTGIDVNGNKITTPEQKLATMDYRYGTDKYELYIDAYSGEVAIKSKSTGEILFTNPYNVGSSTATDAGKNAILSQLIVNYTKISDNVSAYLTSYAEAACRNQIIVKNIKGGIRVEYTIGQGETRSLLPRVIDADSFEAMMEIIKTNLNEKIEAGAFSDPSIEESRVNRFELLYEKYTMEMLFDEYGEAIHPDTTELVGLCPALEDFKNDPAYKDFAFYIFKRDAGPTELQRQERVIKDYYPEYTYDQLEAAHDMFEYEIKIEVSPIFKMALEYTIEDTGLVVDLPANGIRFDETVYRLDSVDVLPYMGAGRNPNKGYTFFPDGSGAIFDFQEIATMGQAEISANIYGDDYAYHSISGKYEEVIRYPVFGIYEQETFTKDVTDENGNTTTSSYTKDRGFVAIIEEGETLMKLSTIHGGAKNYKTDYNSVVMSVMPRPTDSYIMSDVISAGSSSDTPWYVVSDRRYTGDFTVRYIMLTDEDVAKDKGISDFYEPSYVGMAKAYRNYLIDNGILTKLTDVEEDIPLYIETFGALETTERILSIPINVMTPLTTFADIQQMYKDLDKTGISNVNFIMTGYTDGGMTGEKMPYNLNWENAVEKGGINFKELTAYAKKEDFGLFPNFDFVFSSEDALFDGLSLNKHAAKTIDDRYSSKREYSATKHTYVSYYDLVISSAYFHRFYEKFIPKYAKTSPIGISVSTLGSYLNSDFDEDEPYNRNDSKGHTVDAFAYIDKNLKDTEIMTAGGNAYTWKYVDHITDVAVDSSRYSIASASVPFLGIVLHGYVQFSGTAVNMEGNLNYAFLKALESGAALKFILSYRNTSELKEYEELSKYYSVDYSIWYDQGYGDLVELYTELNSLLKDVQDVAIDEHVFLNDGVRIPDSDELKADAAQAVKDAIAYEKALANAESNEERDSIYEARQIILKGYDLIKDAVSTTATDNLTAKLNALKAIYDLDANTGTYAQLLKDANRALDEWKAYQQFNAIYSDIKGTTAKTYDMSTVLKAYNEYMKDTSDTELEAKYNTAYEYAKNIVGQTYLDQSIKVEKAKNDMNAAGNDADKTAFTNIYEAELKKLKELRAGVQLDADALIAAMKGLQPAIDAWVAAGKDDAVAQKAFEEAIQANYGTFFSQDIYYEITNKNQITDNKSRVGGVRAYRDFAKADYTNASAALTEELNKLYAATVEAMDEAEAFQKKYNLDEMKAALELISSKGAYTEPERARLAALVAEIETLLNDPVAAGNFNALLAFDGDKLGNTAYDGYKALYDNTAESGDKTDILKFVIDPKNFTYLDSTTWGTVDISAYVIYEYNTADLLKGEAYERTSKIDDGVMPRPEKPTQNNDKYTTDSNTIVYEVYEDGTAFILNFNNYRVMVEIDGVFYTVDAYGYVAFNKANA